MKAGKAWGHTFRIWSNENFEAHRIVVNAGGYCSKHKHNHKHNIFFVEKGKLKVKVWKKDYKLCDETILNDLETTDVPPGEYHQFEALSPTIAYEIYFSEPIGGDIVRESSGGIHTE